MRGLNRAPPPPVVMLAAALFGASCATPTDKSNDVFVVLQTEGGKEVVLQGQKLGVRATLWRRTGTDSAEIKNVSFQWGTTNPDFATVKDAGFGGAEVTGVLPGIVDVTVRAISFEKSPTVYQTLRISKALEIDSVRPSLVRYGDTMTVYGVGVDSIFIAFLDNATQFDYPIPGLYPTRTRDSAGFATATFWVTPPGRSDRLGFFGPGVFGNAPDSTHVLPFDVYEPNETAPRSINLDAPPRFDSLPAIKFFNPALAFEPTKRDSAGVDWFRFAQSTPRDLTLILSAPEVRGTFSTFLSDSLLFVPPSPPNAATYSIGPRSWTLGPGSHACKGQPFEPPEAQPESTVVALRGMPAGVLHALALYSVPGRYGLAVFEGYLSTLPPDPHEEDDFCDAADARGIALALPGGSFGITLTIDNAHDIDWIKFRVSSLTTVVIKTAAVTSGTAVDSSDVDLFLLTVPGGGASSTLDVVAKSDATGSTETITQPLAPGDYYLVAVDYQGVPVAYALCIDTVPGCATLPVAPVPAARKAPLQSRPRVGP